ncbi:hypothetical protein BASA83_009000 [Batrachochytrium salamandrivorans]|nr:hypothetical protein BASA83_009000 [Batrachochytrium salamandrivorans]
MILPLLLLPLVSFGVVAWDPQRQQRQTVDFSPQPSYRLVALPTRFAQAKYVCTGTNIKFKTNQAQILTQDIERLCKETIDLIEGEKCPPQAVIAEYDSHKVDYENSKKEAKYAHKQWGLAMARAKNGNGRNRSGMEMQRDHSAVNQLGHEFTQLDNEAKSKYRDLIEKWKALEAMKKDCARKKARKEHNYGRAITRKLKQYLRVDEYIKEST